jgi:quercetin dioxygenase-like cupin family protein
MSRRTLACEIDNGGSMRKGIGSPSRHERVFGGQGELLVWPLLSGENILSPFASVTALELAPGASVGPVKVDLPEIVVVTDGVGSLCRDENKHSLAIGSVVEVPQGATLSIDNSASPEPLRYLIVKARERIT